MITWLQNTLQKHNKYLFMALLVVVVVTFAFTGTGTIGPSREPRVEARDFFGYNLYSPRVMESLRLSARISAVLQGNYQLDEAFINEYALNRAAALGLANQWGIGQPTKEQIQAHVQSLRAFQGPDGTFDPALYQRTVSALTGIPMFGGEATLMAVLREDYRIQLVRQALGGPARVIPFELQQDLAATQTTFDVATASLNFSDFQTTVEPTDEELRTFHEQNPARYTLPERLSAFAALFDAANFLGEVPALPAEEELQSYFDRNRSRYETPPPPTPTEEAPAPVTLDTVRDKVIDDWRRDQARQIAEQRSEAFTIALYEREIPRNLDAIQPVAKEFGAFLREVPYYSRTDNVITPWLSEDLLRTAWLFSAGDRYFTDPGKTTDGAAVLLVMEVIPERLQPLEEVLDAVRKNFTEERRREAFLAEGRRLRDELQARLDAGADFAEAAADLGLQVNDLPEFTGGQVPPDLQRSPLWAQSQHLQAGQLSPWVRNANQGSVLFVQRRQDAAVAPDAPEIAGRLEQARQNQSFFAGWQQLNELVDKNLPDREQFVRAL